ncbi:hypothetical protein K501DRAFT_196205 [Backusella circina FSU 941]|nr:hypothetical protein K501DRAFT_196205 [Backusella circina FSU 941]
MISITFLTVIALLFQTIHCFCIYNLFEDDTYFTITDARIDVRPDKLFHKEMHPSAVECCHYSNVDCSPNRKNDENNSFHVYFEFPNFRKSLPRKRVSCTTGGALAFSGNYSQLKVDCKLADGTMVPVEMITDVIKPFDMTDHVN